jgi:predicted amidohydrolase
VADSAATGGPRPLAIALQLPTHSVGTAPGIPQARALLAANIARLADRLLATCGLLATTHGEPVALAVLPEYLLTGAPPAGMSAARFRALAALEPDGPELEALGALAMRAGLYLAVNAYEADPAFPDLYFQACLVLTPAGQVALRYRRLVSLYSPSPFDVWDAYLDRYGADAIFPVLATPFGRLGAVASEEIQYPEIARAVVLRGAEILVHPTSEMGSPRPTGKELARRARAAENLAFVVSANTAGVPGTGLPAQSSTGMSRIIDFEGRILAGAGPGGEHCASAVLDIAALRARRRQPGLANLVARLPLAAFSAGYAAGEGRLPNELAATPGDQVSRTLLGRLQEQTIERLARAGLI